MILAKNNKGAEVELVEAGSYPARVYQMIHIGTVPGFEGKVQNKVRIGFELPTEMKVFDEKKGPQPRVMSQDFTLSFNEKATLRKVITACDSKALGIDDDGFLEEFDVETLIGKTLLVTVAHKAKKDGKGSYAFLENYTALPKGMTCPEAINPVQVLSYDKWNEADFQKLPDFIKEKIEASDEFKSLTPEQRKDTF